jgi:hypothetical protein
MKKIILSLIVSGLIIPSISFAHPGRTDSSGGHTCRTNCANWGLSNGEYHYHRSKGVPQAKEPVTSTYGAQGTGYTTPAPEYKTPIIKKEVSEPIEQKPISIQPLNEVETSQNIQIQTSIVSSSSNSRTHKKEKFLV